MAEPQALTLTLTLLIDQSQNRVVFAESDHRFVDILFSFLTLPISTILRLLHPPSPSPSPSSPLSSLHRLFASVQDLPPHSFLSPSAQSMLLRPRSAAAHFHTRLAINLNDYDHLVYYKCLNSSSRSCGVSAVPGVRCACGGRFDLPICAVGSRSGDGKREEGVFVKEEGRFLVGDDLRVRPVSMGESLEVLGRLGIRDGSLLEKKTVELGENEIVKLLEKSLVSSMPLTDVFLRETDIIDVQEKSVVTDITQARFKQKRATTDTKRINLKLYLSTDIDKVVYAEAGEDFVDFLFSFLVFPLGSIIKLLEKQSSIGCIDKLYDSVELLSNDIHYMKSKECTDILLAPMLPPHFGCHHQLLNIKEELPSKIRTCACKTCVTSGTANKCFHGYRFNIYDEINPKNEGSNSENGEGFVRRMKFMVTDEMKVMPLSPISGFRIINKLMVPIGSLEEAEVSLGEAEALNLLKACLVSDTVLSDVFSPYLLTLLQQKWYGQLPGKSVA